jgi:ParB-like chromosome segregation protein Spo0J
MTDIDIKYLYLTTKDHDEIVTTNLEKDININGYNKPITVIEIHMHRYEIISGQRRYLAMKQMNKTLIPCNILNIHMNRYEIISGQRRYLIMKQLNKTHIPCNILNIQTYI